tara:strand:- start:151 stop:768 length:618 start_codon:yes stop_codon:yes gene_type:complete
MTQQVYIILDRSGSMATCIQDTLGGLQYFLDSLEDSARVTLLLFNQTTEVLYRDAPKGDWTPLTPQKYRPHGTTALMDAIGETIKMADIHEPRLWADQEDNTISIVILTDGDENSSKAYTSAHVGELINRRRTQDWNFVFLGANHDAIMRANSLNIPQESAMTFSNETVDTAMRSAADALNRMVSGESQSVEFSHHERMASQPSN